MPKRSATSESGPASKAGLRGGCAYQFAHRARRHTGAGDRVRTLVAGMDVPGAGNGNVRVVQLKNAEAAKLAETLRGLMNASQSTSATATPNITSTTTPATLAAAAPSTAPSSNIQADAATNSLIISAPENVHNGLRNVIEKLDQRRAQVAIDAIVVELTTSAAAEFGIQWQDLSGLRRGDGSQVIGGTNFGTTGNIIGAASNLSTIGGGLNLGLVRGRINIPGLGEVIGLAGLAKALESDQRANILARPPSSRWTTSRAASRWAKRCPSFPANTRRPAPRDRHQSVPDHHAAGCRPETQGHAAGDRGRHPAEDRAGGVVNRADGTDHRHVTAAGGPHHQQARDQDHRHRRGWRDPGAGRPDAGRHQGSDSKGAAAGRYSGGGQPVQVPIETKERNLMVFLRPVLLKGCAGHGGAFAGPLRGHPPQRGVTMPEPNPLLPEAKGACWKPRRRRPPEVIHVFHAPLQPATVRLLPYHFAKSKGVITARGRVEIEVWLAPILRRHDCGSSAPYRQEFEARAVVEGRISGAAVQGLCGRRAGSDAVLEIASNIESAADLSELTASLPEVTDLLETENDAPIIVINARLRGGAREGASDLHFEIFERRAHWCASASMARCAMWSSKRSLTSSDGVLWVKVMAGLDIAEKRLPPQDGRITCASPAGRSMCASNLAHRPWRARGAQIARQGGRAAHFAKPRHGTGDAAIGPIDSGATASSR